MRHLVREVAVVGDEDQTFGVKVETADGIDALAHAANEIDHGAAALRIFDRGHHFLRLVEEDVAVRLGLCDQLAVDFDVMAIGVRSRSELGDDAAVHGHAPFTNHHLGFTS